MFGVAATWIRSRSVNDLMRDMAYKVSQNILRRWAEEAGEAFDWYLEGYPDIPGIENDGGGPAGRNKVLDTAEALSSTGEL